MEYHDDIYGNFFIPEDICSIIKTNQFQRLKKIKQLGLLYHFIPNATNTRYDHCIGTYYQAREVLKKIQENTETKSEIPLVYIKAVEIAALLHDVGHGPFSHTWEHVTGNYKHEETSSNCVDNIFQTLPGFDYLQDYGIELIKAFILGEPRLLSRPIEDEYRFLFEIVNNKQCKLDVDKLDYLKRDAHYLRAYSNKIDIQLNLDFDDVFYESRASADGAHIEYRFRDYAKIFNVFETRFQLHLNCYQMKKCLLFENILGELLQRHLHVKLNGKKLDEINATSGASFLLLTDERVMAMLKSLRLSEWMLDINNIEELSDNAIAEEDYLKVYSVLPFAGSEMPPDHKFHFYGNESEKTIIQRRTGNEIIKAQFRYRLTLN